MDSDVNMIQMFAQSEYFILVPAIPLLGEGAAVVCSSFYFSSFLEII